MRVSYASPTESIVPALNPKDRLTHRADNLCQVHTVAQSKGCIFVEKFCWSNIYTVEKY